MSSTSKHRREKSAKARRREQVRWLSTLTILFVLIIFGWIAIEEYSQENQNLSLIGQGQNVVVQVHDPG